MKKILFWFVVITFLANADVFAQTKIKNDTLKTIVLLEKEAAELVNETKIDSISRTEDFKLSPNYIFKSRLDSISSSVSLDYNPYVQTYIDAFTTKRKAEMGKMLGLGKYYFPIFEKALSAYKIPLEFKYLPIIESSLNPMAVSKTGATGLWQFTFTTGKDYGLANDEFVDERRDPIEASYAAAAYLKDAYREFGDWLLALASYNCGGGTVRRAILKVGNKPNFWDIQAHLPLQTQTYVPAFIAANYMMNYYDKHDVKILEEVNLKTDSVYLNKHISFQKIAEALNMYVVDLHSLNPAYKKNIINGTSNAPKRLIIPKIAVKNFFNFYEAINTDEALAHENFTEFNTNQTIPIEKEVKRVVTSHTVKQGENLTIIANLYLVDVQDLKDWNNLNSAQIAVGQKLVVSK